MGSEKPPVPNSFNLSKPQDLEALAALRDQLADYLATVERNTDSVRNWLAENKSKIILFHQRLERALNNKDENLAISLIPQMGDIAGFVLNIQDFKAKAEAAFGKDNAFLKSTATITDILPPSLHEPLPELSPSGETVLPRALLDNQPVKPEEVKKWWSSVSGWFNKEEKQREQQERDFRRQLHAVKAEILGIQSDRHYYIDSFMDWIADSLSPETADENGKAPESGAKMLQYQNPSYIIGLAHADYQDAVENKAKIIRDAALDYSTVANAIDRQDAADIELSLTKVYPGKPTENSKLFRGILLDDYQSSSFADIILKNISSRGSQAKLLNTYLSTVDSEKLSFNDAKSPQAIFEKIVRLVLNEKNPLDPATLYQVTNTLRRQSDVSAEKLALAATPGERNIFQRVVERFADDLPAQKATLCALLFGMNGDIPTEKGKNIAEDYVNLYESLSRGDEFVAGMILSAIAARNSALEIVSLWHLCHPGVSLLDQIRNVSSDPAVKSSLLGRSLSAGLLDELRIDGAHPYGYGYPHSAAYKFEKLMETDVLPALDTFSVSTARLLIAHSFSTGGLEGLRDLLAAPEGWLKQIVSSKIDTRKKAEWVAACLEPFASDIVKTNILAEAAQNSGDVKSGAILSSLERNLIGENVRLTEDKILCNLPLIANIWYNTESKMLRYTVQGQSHTLLEDVEHDMAGEILSLLQRRGGFMRERDGLFKPENIDAIHHNGAETTISWHRAAGVLNADLATLSTLKSRTDFLHVTDHDTGNVSSYNVNSICLLQKMDDGSSLLIDKYGTSHILDGEITSPLVNDPVYFNPDNASIIRINPKKNSFEFRVESSDFEKLMAANPDDTDPDDPDKVQFFYTVELSDPGTLSQLQKSCEGNQDIHAPNKATLPGLYFNMKALGYLDFDEKAAGFYCRRYSPTNKPGFIQVDDDMKEEIMAGIGKESGVIRIDDLLVHENSIDDAYYNAGKEKLQFVIGRAVEEVHAEAEKGWGALLRLMKNKHFITIAKESLTLDSNGVADIVQLNRATLLSHSPAQEMTHVITENLPFHINLSGQNAMNFFASLEEQGLTSARPATKLNAWIQGLGAVIAQLPELGVRVSPAVRTETQQILLQQALGLVKPDNGHAKKLRDSFATVSSLPAAYDRFVYPERKKAEAPETKTTPALKKPRPSGPKP